MKDYKVPVTVNIPELFYQRFLADLPIVDVASDGSPRNTLLNKLNSVKATRRGRGFSRWLKGDNAITREEWNALYELAAEGRSRMQGADRASTLTPAICARALADRMEKIGVDSIIPYTPKFRATKKTVTTATPEPVAPVVNTDVSTQIPVNPPVVDQTVDVDEVDDNDLDYFNEELANN
jgi:hypothetical protein